MSAVEGCSVCGKNHNARKDHSKEEVDKAVNRLKGTGAYVSVEEAIEVFFAEDNSDDNTSESESSEDGASANCVEQIQDLNVELTEDLNNYCFAHGYGFKSRREAEYKKMDSALKSEGETIMGVLFGGILIDPGANYLSMISMEQIPGICLLYTSPSPRDQRGSRMPSSA